MSHQESKDIDIRQPFPRLLHLMLDDFVQEGRTDLMGWSKCGNHFYLPTEDVLPDELLAYFPHGNYKSLRRQLSQYCFGRLKVGKYSGFWTNQYFHRDLEQCDFDSVMNERKRRGSGSLKSSSDSENPSPAKRAKPTVSQEAKLSLLATENTGPRKGAKNGRIFPENLHSMVTYFSKKGSKAMSWSKDGKSFFMDARALAKELEDFTKFFYHGNPKSLSRQISIYNFVRIASGPNQGNWYHPSFTSQSGMEVFLKMKSESGYRLPKAQSRSTSDDESMPSLSQESFSFDSSPSVTLVAKATDLFCQNCCYYDGKICCSVCPGNYHQNCTTSRCVGGHYSVKRTQKK